MAEWGLSDFQDARKIDSACARPRTMFGDHTPYADAASKAAALGWDLCRHPPASSTATSASSYRDVYFLMPTAATTWR